MFVFNGKDKKRVVTLCRFFSLFERSQYTKQLCTPETEESLLRALFLGSKWANIFLFKLLSAVGGSNCRGQESFRFCVCWGGGSLA